MQHPAVAQQGHLYEYQGERVIAMNSGRFVRVRPIIGEWLGDVDVVEAEELTPLPMRYFYDELPS